MQKQKTNPNYFNQLPLRRQLKQLGKCRFMDRSEFGQGVSPLKGRKIVIIGCGAQGLNQALCLRDSKLDVAIALREEAIAQKRPSWKSANEHQFKVGSARELVPKADLVINLTPDKQHSDVIAETVPLMKKGACLSYSHGFNIVEQGENIRPDIPVIMVAPKGPGTEVRREYQRGFGVPTLIAVHEENDPRGDGLALASAYAVGIGADRAGVLESSFVAEVKSDLMGEQTILCGLLQTGSLLCFDHMVANKIPPGYAAGLVQHGWEVLGEALKHGGVGNMMSRLDDASMLRAFDMAEELKEIMRPLFEQHMDDITGGEFSSEMMQDWRNDDKNLLAWRAQISRTAFEQATGDEDIPEQHFYDHGILMVAILKSGVELAFDVMRETGIKDESAYYESLHELPLIANLIGRQKLYEMNRVISDTAEYGCHLFSERAIPLLKDYVSKCDVSLIGQGLADRAKKEVDGTRLNDARLQIDQHPIEAIGRSLRRHMTTMKKVI